MRDEILRMEHVTAHKDDNLLLDDFNLHIYDSEIMGLICINKNGQDFLIDLLEQNLRIQYGRIYINESLVNSYQHGALNNNKVAVIEQKSRLIEDLTVADNVFVMRKRFKKYIISSRTLQEQLNHMVQEFGISLNGGKFVSQLTQYERCVAELLRAVVIGAKLIIIRDIGNILSTADLIKFHDLLHRFCKRGISFLYVCSHHEEAFKICDRVSIMRDGKILKVLDKKEFNDENIVPYYIDEFATVKQERVIRSSNDEILVFKDVTTEHLNSLTFAIARGECTVLMDLDNTVLNDIIGLINGDVLSYKGEIYLKDKLYKWKDAKRLFENGISFIWENPVQTMLFPDMSYLSNLSFLVDKKRNPLNLNKRVLKSIADEFEPIVGNDIYATDLDGLRMQSLYNLVYYRILLSKPDIVFCVQPFNNADMYLRRHIIELINQFKKQNITVVMLVTNMADCLVIADKLVTLANGKFVSEYPRSQFYLFKSESIIL